MTYFVYIIQSVNQDLYYKGFSTDISHRLIEHNSGLSRYTSGKGPWELVYLREFKEKREALIEELRIKKLNRKSIEKMVCEFRQSKGSK